MESPPTVSVLLVEDDLVLAEMVRDYLGQQGFDLTIEGRGDTAVARILDTQPPLVILDLGLPGLNGIEVCRQVRAQYRGLILVLTAQGDEIDEVTCLEIGADDFIAKPVRPRVLLARMRALLRRRLSPADADSQTPIEIGDLKIAPQRREAYFQDQALGLTTSEYDLLSYLAAHAGNIVSRQDLYRDLRGIPYDGLDRSIDLRVSRLRTKLEQRAQCPELIKSVRGIGYLLVKPG